jgi:hypothetical protein
VTLAPDRTTLDPTSAAPSGDDGRRVRLARALRGPGAVAGAALGGLAYLAVVDPNQPGHLPLCPFKALTGLDCPGCGSMRALHDLTHGDVLGALDHNVLVVLALPFLAWRWWAWTARARSGRPGPQRLAPAWVLWSLVGVLVVFWVVRNLPGIPFLGSGVG